MVRIGVFSSDPSACDAFHAFDPESGIIYPAINDSLVYIDCEGVIRPGLAIAWRRLDPLTMEFDLREGVRFHNGDLFTADDVVATMRAQRDPKNRSANGQGILSSIDECVRVHDYQVRLRTSFPDGMLLNRLHIASAVYPRSILERHGPRAFLEHPIGTGGYIFERWDRGREIVLRRNPDHWAQAVTVDELRFPIMDQKDWVDALQRRQLDIALNLDPHDALRVHETAGLEMRRREAAFSHWFLLNNEGPLADRRVRLALNYAVHRHLLCNVASHGWATPQTSLLTPGQVGYDPTIAPYPYDPDYARILLREAGYADGFTLRGLVSESSSSVFQLLRGFLAKIGVRLEANFVPRPEWLNQVVNARIRGDASFDGDFAFVNIDNFTLHGLFHHFIFLFSQGPFSLMSSPEYDRRFLETAIKIEPDEMQRSLEQLDRYAREEALLLFTIRQQVYCGVRRGFHIPIGISGHFNFDNLWHIRVDHDMVEGDAIPYTPKVVADDPALASLLSATTYPGIIYSPQAPQIDDPALAALWRNIQLHEKRWQIQADEMIRGLVEQVTASTNLQNVLRSTREVGILGISRTGRILFVNSGYPRVMGCGSDVPLSQVLLDDEGQPAWPQVVETTEREGMSSGVWNVIVSVEDRRRILLTATPATNEFGAAIGYVCVLTDHSKEEERLRMSQEMDVARRIQTALLPAIDETRKQTLAAAMIPAEEVGGDYYDIIVDGNGVRWYGIGDVSGHGVTSGLIMLMTHCIVRTIIETAPDLSMDEILSKLNSILYDDILRLGESYHLTFGLLKSLGDGDYIAAGAHEDVIIHRAATGECETIPFDGCWFGLVPDIAGSSIELRFHLDPGDTVVLYTDGIIEAEAPDGSMWEVSRFIASIQRHAHLPPDEMKSAILQDVMNFMGTQLDDITMMILRRGEG
ncbi:MAG: SpoIIE family protein phosphatase [Myxococcales bacterium]|nr:SpoIIE family protein phosphatase [Myxococcales bacterium]